MSKAIFLDRDGVICKEKSYVTKLEDLEIESYARECVSAFKLFGFKTVVITNQSAVARGLMTEINLISMHEYLKEELDLDQIYYCPHYNEKMSCFCRKPGIALFERAIKEFNIDPQKSFMVGDRASDILAGKNAGVKTVLVRTGYGKNGLEFPVEPNYIFDDLRAFASFLTKQENEIVK